MGKKQLIKTGFSQWDAWVYPSMGIPKYGYSLFWPYFGNIAWALAAAITNRNKENTNHKRKHISIMGCRLNIFDIMGIPILGYTHTWVSHASHWENPVFINCFFHIFHQKQQYTCFFEKGRVFSGKKKPPVRDAPPTSSRSWLKKNKKQCLGPTNWAN